MTFEEYAAAFSAIKGQIRYLSDLDEFRAGETYRAFERDAAVAGALENLPPRVLVPADLPEKKDRLLRLYRKYLTKFARACDLLENPTTRHFMVEHYLYGMTYEEIAAKGHFAVRTVYRRAREGRRQLERYLLLMKPKPCRTPPARYHLNEPGHRVMTARRLHAEWKKRAPNRDPRSRAFSVRPERAFYGETYREKKAGSFDPAINQNSTSIAARPVRSGAIKVPTAL